MGNKALDEALKALKATPEYKDWKKVDNVYLEAYEAYLATPEYEKFEEAKKALKKTRKVYFEAKKALDKADKAYWETLATEYKDTEEENKAEKEAMKALEKTRKDWDETHEVFWKVDNAYWDAMKAAHKAWDALYEANSVDCAAIKALESTPEYKAYIKAGGTCRELRRN